MDLPGSAVNLHLEGDGKPLSVRSSASMACVVRMLRGHPRLLPT